MSGKKRTRWVCCAVSVICFYVLLCGPAFAEESITVSEKVQQIVSEVIKAEMSEEDMALVLHDWLTDHAYYDLTFSNYEADGVLLHQTGVCDSYSKAYQLLLNEVGIENFRVTGTALDSTGKLQSHSWNAVKTDGKWHYVDVTWDDPVDADGNAAQVPKSGNENHLYFLGSSQLFQEDHFPDTESEKLIEGLFSEEEEALPAPVNTSARVEVPDFSLETSDGKILTKEGYGKGKKLLMVYGRTTCLNTSGFLNYIKPYIGRLKEKNVTVLLALYDDPDVAEMKKMETQYPGIVCTKITENDQSMWEGLFAFKFNGSSVTFPVIFLKNAGNQMVYYSTGYVDNPLAVVAGAMAIPEDSAPKQIEATSGSSEEKGTSTENENEKSTENGGSTVKTASQATVGNGVYHLSGSVAVLTGPKTRNIKKLTIPATVKIGGKTRKVTKIAANAFKGCTKLTTVTIGKYVTSIGAGAFSGCKALTKVSIGAGVKMIGKNAFLNCAKLTTVSGGKGLTTIGASAYSGCKALTRITLYGKVKKIGAKAFYKSSKLKTITIKTTKLTIKTVGANAFRGIYAKATIKVPKSKLKVYTTLLKKKGIGKNVKIKK